MPRVFASASAGSVGDLDAAGLAAAAGQHLRLDDDAAAAERLGAGSSLFGRVRDAALAGRDAVAGEELLALMFVEIHGWMLRRHG